MSHTVIWAAGTLAGILGSSKLDMPLWPPMVFCLILLPAGLIYLKISKRYSRTVLISAGFFVFLTMGIMTFQLHMEPDMPFIKDGDNVAVWGRISTHPAVYGGMQYFTLDVLLLKISGQKVPGKGAMEIQAENAVSLNRDDLVFLEGCINQGRVRCAGVEDAGIPGYGFYGFRKKAYLCLKESYYRRLNHNYAAVCEALVLGNRTGFPDRLSDGFKKAGIYHILAISGMHISVLGFFIMRIMKKAPRSLMLAVTGLFLLGLNFLVGMKASLLRASSMMLMAMLASAWGRNYCRRDVFFTAFSALLLLFPSYLSDLGFWLSFVSYGAIIFIAPLIEKLTAGSGRWLKPVIITFSINLAVLPLNAYFWKMFSVAGLYSNLIVLPVFYPFMMVLLIISFLIIIWPPLDMLLVLARPFLYYITSVAGIIGKMRFSCIEFADFPIQAAVIYYVILFSLLLLLYKYLLLRDINGKKQS